MSTTTNRTCTLLKAMTVEIREKPMPLVRDDDVLVKVEATGICGSDVSDRPIAIFSHFSDVILQLHMYSHGGVGTNFITEPLVLGHESAGTVVQVGANVKNIVVGDRVAIEPTVFCRK